MDGFIKIDIFHTQAKGKELFDTRWVLSNISKEKAHLRDSFDSVVDSATAIAKSWNVDPTFKRSRCYFFSNQRFINYFDDPIHFFKVNIFNVTLDIDMNE